MNFNEKLQELYLLNHPFYQAWNDGSLSINVIQKYASEYYHHVAAFPRYVSQIHALCSDIKCRQTLLNNLIDEELGNDNHPELWMRFTKGIGSKITNEPDLQTTKDLVNGYFDLVKTDYATGLGALYAYERQTSKVSQSKIEGLKKHYGIHSERILQFFTVHAEADVWHTADLEHLIQKLTHDERINFENGAITGAKLLWNFLSGMNECMMNS